MLGSIRQRVTLVSHVLLLSMVAVAWYYVLLAGKVVTERYLDALDLQPPEERVTVLQLKASVNLSNSSFSD